MPKPGQSAPSTSGEPSYLDKRFNLNTPEGVSAVNRKLSSIERRIKEGTAFISLIKSEQEFYNYWEPKVKTYQALEAAKAAAHAAKTGEDSLAKKTGPAAGTNPSSSENPSASDSGSGTGRVPQQQRPTQGGGGQPPTGGGGNGGNVPLPVPIPAPIMPDGPKGNELANVETFTGAPSQDPELWIRKFELAASTFSWTDKLASSAVMKFEKQSAAALWAESQFRLGIDLPKLPWEDPGNKPSLNK